eukprot:TRINITY_DN23964_c1_g4_i1.p1 TRINITY_DN23964_c1_g4~~TRINITY_DN23964_c1_g4_i1.p1  ORF type:complete len:878 (+),score=130.15 TRINITY_DN23964_c1_g4_i1:119-2752(+)
MNVSNQSNVGGADVLWNGTHHEVSPSSTVLVMLCTFLIISMQLGFAMLEVGSVREEHRMTVLTKNLMDSVVSCLAFALVCEVNTPGLIQDERGVVPKHMMLFEWSFLTTTVTICSGSMAERTHMFAYLSYAMVMSGFVYPIIADSAWGKGSGLLHHCFHNVLGTDHDYKDFAGSGVVHLTGGTAALVGNVWLGRRIMRPRRNDCHTIGLEGEVETVIEPSGQECASSQMEVRSPQDGTLAEEDPRLKDALFVGWQRRFDCVEDDDTEFRTNSYLQVMGMFNLWVGWYGFNTAPAFANGGLNNTQLAGIIAWNTTLAASTGSLGVFLYIYAFRRNIDIGFLCNGVLSGLVAITASCDAATPLAAGLIGFVAGTIVYPLGSHLLKQFWLDDPLDAIPVHAGCGLFGVLARAFCPLTCSEETFSNFQSCSAGNNVGLQLLTQTFGAFTIICYTLCITLLLWMLFVMSEGIRLHEVEHLVTAYKQAGMMLLESSNSASCEPEIWRYIASHSRTARFILQNAGWKGGSLEIRGQSAIEHFRDQLLEAIQERVKSALELKALPIRFVRCVACVLVRARPLRELAVLRLRISPFAELSGLGVAASDGGQVLHAMTAMMKVVSEIRHAQSANVPLRMEVDQLTRHVHSQGLLLQRLTRGRRLRTEFSVARLSSVPEGDQHHKTQDKQEKNHDSCAAQDCSELRASGDQQLPRLTLEGATTPPTSMESRTRGREMQRGNQPGTVNARSSTPEERPAPACMRSETASTVSDGSIALLSPHSTGDQTPLPNIYGAFTPRSTQASELEVQAQQLAQATQEEVTAQLVAMLQVQQNLMASLHGASAAQHPAANYNANANMNRFHQELLEAMQQQGLANGYSRPPSTRSSN